MRGGPVEARDESDRDMAVIRWMDTSKYDAYINDPEMSSYIEHFGRLDIPASTAFGDWYEDGELQLVANQSEGVYQYYLDGKEATSSTVKTLVRNYITENDYANLRPGDIVITATHTLMYIGNGYVLDCSGNKYSTVDGEDQVEKNGAVYNRMKTLTNILAGTTVLFAIIRPLDYYAYDMDGVLGNDIMLLDGDVLSVKESTKSRIEYPAMDIDRTVDITPYGSAAKGETLTYSIKITNNTKEKNWVEWRHELGYSGEAYEDLAVSETVPAGTVFLSASEGYVLDGDKISWCIGIPAGESVTLSYTVRVTAEIGEVITSDGGFVASIPSNSISNRVGGAKLTGEQIDALKAIAARGADSLSDYGRDLEFAEAIFAEIGISLELTSVSELVANLFSAEYFDGLTVLSEFYYDRITPIMMYTPDKDVADEYKTIAAMLVDGYIGGRRMFTMDTELLREIGLDGFDYSSLNDTIIDFSLDFLEAGDILVYATARDRETANLSNEMSAVSVMVYAGDGVLIEMNSDGTANVYNGANATARLVSAYKNTNDIFFLLRPTQVG